MINFGWNTTGRIDKDAYRKERRRHFLFCLIPIAMFVGAGASAATLPWLSAILSLVGFILITYYRYRFMQIMVKRLHDRNLSGKLMILSPLILVGVLFIGGGWLFTTLSSGGMPSWLNETTTQIIILAVLLPAIGFNIFLRFQMNKPGTPGPNKYGSPSGIGQALIF